MYVHSCAHARSPSPIVNLYPVAIKIILPQVVHQTKLGSKYKLHM